MSEYFQRLANDVLQASEELSAIMEDGITAMMKGELPKASTPPADPVGDMPGGDEFMDEMIEDELMDSPLQGIAESVMGEIMGDAVKPVGFMENFEAFRTAITWNEPFIMGLVAFQIVMFGLAIAATRPNVGLAPRLVLMSFIALIVRTSEYWNAYATQHWEKFATQNYFDNQGVFVALMVSSPLLMDCLLMLILFVKEAAQLLVSVKRNEIKRQRATHAKANKNKKGDAKTESKKEQ